MNTGIYDYIEIDQVLASVKGDVGIMSETVYDPSFDRWINDAVAQMDTCDFYVKKPCLLTIECGKAKLPKGFRRLLGLRYSASSLLDITSTDLTMPDLASLKAVDTTSAAAFPESTTVLLGSIGIFTLSRAPSMTVATVNALKALNTTSAVTYPEGYAVMITGTGIFALNRTSTATADNITIIQPTTGPGRWLKVNSNTPNNVTIIQPTVGPGLWIETTSGPIDLIDNPANNTCYNILYLDQTFSEDCGCTSNSIRTRQYFETAEIVDGYLVFRNLPSSVTTVELSYMGIPISNECLYFIPPDFERACSAYARARFYEAYPEVKGVQVSMALMQQSWKEWAAQKDLMKAKAAKRNFDDNKYMIRMYFTAWFTVQNKIWS